MRQFMTTVTAVCALAVIAVGVLAGCGASGRNGASTGVVPMQRINCGSAVNPAAVQCFAAAVRTCRAATITETTMLVDTGTHNVFVTDPGTSPCQVTERSQFYMVSGGIRHGPVTTTPCRVSATAAASRVVLSCHGRVVMIPGSISGCSRYTGLRCTLSASTGPTSGRRRG